MVSIEPERSEVEAKVEEESEDEAPTSIGTSGGGSTVLSILRIAFIFKRVSLREYMDLIDKNAQCKAKLNMFSASDSVLQLLRKSSLTIRDVSDSGYLDLRS
jgi:hypothetical protein